MPDQSLQSYSPASRRMAKGRVFTIPVRNVKLGLCSLHALLSGLNAGAAARVTCVVGEASSAFVDPLQPAKINESVTIETAVVSFVDFMMSPYEPFAFGKVNAN